MAIPPDPIEELLPEATWVVDAEVKEVLQNGPPAPKVNAPPGWTDTGQKAGSQLVKLSVKRVLKGADVKELTVEKPVAGYALKAGVKGPFLLDATRPHPVILGRYGPDSYSFDKVEKALKK